MHPTIAIIEGTLKVSSLMHFIIQIASESTIEIMKKIGPRVGNSMVLMHMVPALLGKYP
jgi:hypothetical protein